MAVSRRTKARPRPNAVKHPTPLHELRFRGGLSIPALSKRFNVSTATIARWLNGDRAAPRRFIKALQWAAAAHDLTEVEAAQRRYVERRRRREKPPILEVALPAGVDVAEARRLALEAIRNAMARAKAQAEVGSS